VSSSLPVLGLIVDRPPAAAVAPLLADLRRWCRPMVAGAGEVQAWLATSWRAVPDDGRPAAAWVDDIDELQEAEASSGRTMLLLTGDPRVADRARTHVVVVTGGVNSRDVLPITPFVRSRMRAGRGLGAELVVEADQDGARVHPGGPIDSDLLLTALCLCSAAAMTGPGLVQALMWGTPCVTDEATAALIGAEPERDVLVAPDGERLAAARALSADDVAAARAARLGRRLVERVHDRAAAVDRVRDALLSDGPERSAAVWHRLDELRAPLRAPIRVRAAAAVAAIAVGGRQE
jgi:hypothetical protein